MQLKSEKKEIDGLKFEIIQFPARKSLKLEKRTLTYLAPMLSLLEGFSSLDNNIDMVHVAKSIQNTLLNLDEEALESFIFAMLETTNIYTKNANGQEQILKINNPEIFDYIFIGKNITVYKLLIEVMRVNKFAFFELLAGSGLLIDIFQSAKQKTIT